MNLKYANTNLRDEFHGLKNTNYLKPDTRNPRPNKIVFTFAGNNFFGNPAIAGIS